MGMDPDIAEMHIAYAWNMIRTGNLREALRRIREVNDVGADDPDNAPAEALAIGGSIYEGLGDTENALASYELHLQLVMKKLEKDPDNVAHLFSLCLSYLGLGKIYTWLSRIEDAFTCFNLMHALITRYLSILPDDIAALKMKAIACQSLCDLYLKQDVPSGAFPYCTAFKETSVTLLAALSARSLAWV